MDTEAYRDVQNFLTKVGVRADECIIADHQSAMEVRDLEELIQSALNGFQRIRELREGNQLRDPQLLQLSRKPCDFGKKIMRLIDAAIKDGYAIEGEAKFRQTYREFFDFIVRLERTTQAPPRSETGPVALSHASPPTSCDAAIDLSLLSGIVSGLLVAAYTEWSPWAGFAVGGIAMAFLTALACSARLDGRSFSLRTPGGGHPVFVSTLRSAHNG